MTLRQQARALGVSLATVRAWQAAGLLHRATCAWCRGVAA